MKESIHNLTIPQRILDLAEEGEEIRPIEGAPDYFVSDRGRVFSAKKHGGRARVLKLTPNVGGYLTFATYEPGGKQVRRNVHQEVATAFLGTRPAGMDVCHNDGTRDNNCASNLRYDTRSGNFADKLKHGTHNRGENSSTSLLTEEQVVKIREDFANGATQKDLAARYGVTRSTIQVAVKGKTWAHAGGPISTTDRRATRSRSDV